MKKINFHFTSICNMKCRYCFVPQNQNLNGDELLEIIRKISESGIFDGINFVGGEPTTSKFLLPMIKEAKRFGLKTSIVTNGYVLSKMPQKDFEEIVKNLDCVGLSVDSLDEDSNRKIGRAVGKSILSRSDYEKLCLKIKKLGCKLKINTVVSKLNLNEDFNSFYETVKPDRIKIFQVLKPNVCTKNCYDDLLISSDEYNSFLLRHSAFEVVSENNSDMTSAYYMLGSDGCFWDNATGKKSESVLSVPIEDALNSVFVDEEKYQRRYA